MERLFRCIFPAYASVLFLAVFFEAYYRLSSGLLLFVCAFVFGARMRLQK